MKTILVPVDFSDTGNNAALFAANLAEFYGADLWMYHAYELPVSLSEYAFPLVGIEEMQSAAEHELEQLKKKTLSKLRRNININIETEMSILQDGIDALCEKIKPDLIVMGLSGKNALTKLIVGSNTIKAIYHSKYPVLVIPPKAEFLPVKMIGFACDYNKVLETTPVAPLKKIIHDFGARLHIMNVEPGDQHAQKAGLIQESLFISELMNEFHPEYHTILAGDITEGINWFVDQAKLDWIVLIPKKHNLMDKIFRRSHTKEMIYHTHVPVLCMHD